MSCQPDPPLSMLDGVPHLSLACLLRWLPRAGDPVLADRIEAELRRRATLPIALPPCRCCASRNRRQQGTATHRGVCGQCWTYLRREMRAGRATDGELVACGLLEGEVDP